MSVDRHAINFIDKFENRVEDVKNSVQGVKDAVKDNFAVDVNGIKNAGRECHTAAKETSTMCTTTTTKSIQLLSFGVEMKSALDGLNNGIDVQHIASLRNVLNRDKMSNALDLASEMDDLALSCAQQSAKMIDTIDSGIQTLPNILGKNLDRRLEHAKEKGGKDSDPELPDLEQDLVALEETAKGVRSSNPLSAIETFQKAFDGISANSTRCKDMFTTMKDFADDVAGVSDTINQFKMGNVVGRVRELVKDIWRCLRLSDLIRSFAKAVETLIKRIIDVIKALIEKIQIFDVENIMANCGCCTEIESAL
eukprot:CAMPEP_0195300726 /NCGR_PEP_ID=MMETSP0707-20130614/28016_1 /TAXON_ID=33640 /ORGANISM="Asterionellopsis glacialis, Strain CCMP134" /LENGTH=308 /DNA_ID=CAMNT_0040363499 /DNA_START=65 /DNA_END=988 /DNA_ORIENTATION=-